MSRPLASLTKQAVFSGETGEAFLILLTIDHDTLGAPIRVSSDAADTASRGETFVAFPFDLSLPEDGENRAPRARLVIDNVDRQIVQAVRSLGSAPTVLMEIVRASDPDTVEARFADFRLVNVSYDARTVRGELAIEDFTAEPYPAGVFSPGLFPGLF